MRPTRGAAILATAAVLIGGLTACGEDEPTEPTSTTASPIDKGTESESPSESSSASGDSDGMPEDMPAEAKEQTKEGAAAFGEYYQTEYGKATVSGDTTTIKSLRSDQCNACIAGEQQIEEDKEKGWVRSSNPYSFTSPTATKRPDEGYKISMDVSAKKHYRVDSTGESNAVIDPVKFTVNQHVVWHGGHWTMNSWIATER